MGLSHDKILTNKDTGGVVAYGLHTEWGGAPRANQRRSRRRGVSPRYSLGRGFKNNLRAGLLASVPSYPQTRLAVGEMDPQGRPSQFAGPERFSEEAKVDHVSAFRRTVLCRDI
jgi:hypothetical protein